MPSDALSAGADGRPRCFWAVGGAPESLTYHDDEWGRPVLGDANTACLLADAGIARDRLEIEAAITDARAVVAVVTREQDEAARFS